jgi:spore maturation protein CgeB
LAPAVIDEIRGQTSAPIVNWLPDDPFLALRPAVHQEALRRYDVIVTYSPDIARRIGSELSIRSMVIPFGFDPTDYRAAAVASQPSYDVAFVGQFRPERAAIVESLAGMEFKLLVSGPGWGRAAAAARGAWRATPSFGTDACARYQEARIGLNILHPENNRGSHNMRTWEILASGTPMLTTDTAQQRQLLDGISGVGFYSDPGTLEHGATKLIRDGRRPTSPQLEKHTYASRCDQLLRAL